MLFDKIAYPQILVPNTPATDQSTYTDYSSIPIYLNIQPESPTMIALTGGEVFATYHFFTLCPYIQVGWRLKIGDDTYTVRGIQPYDYGPGQHYEGTLIRDHQ